MSEEFVKLGKLPYIPKAKDLKYTNYKSASLPPIPETFGHQDKISNWGMMANDSLGDCVIAGAIHASMLWTTEGGKPATFTPANAISDYSSACGYIPGNPSTDRGCYIRSVLDYQRNIGIIDANGVRHKIGAYLALDLSNLQEVLEAIYLFSVVKIGFIFPSSAMSQFYAGQPWTVVDGSTINGAHDVEIIGYDKDWLYVITWGKVQKMSFDFYQKYCDESWVALSNEMLNGSGLSPEGFNLTQLQADLVALHDVTPPPTLTSIAFSPTNVNLQVGTSQTVAVIATYSDGSTSNIINQVTFTNANTKVATMLNGVIQAISSGSTTVVANYSGKTTQINIIVINTNYTLTTDNTLITSQVNTPLNIKVKLMNNSTPVPNQPIQSIYSGVIQSGGVSTTDNSGIATFKIDTSKIGQINANYVWIDATKGIKYNLYVTINIVDIPKPIIHNYALTTDQTTLTSPINTPLNINVKLTDNNKPLSTSQPIQLIYTGVSSGGGASNTDNLGVAKFTINSDKIGVNNLSFIWFDAPTGTKYTLLVTVNWIDKVDPSPTKKLWHVQSLPINSLKTAEIQAQQAKLKELGYSVYSTISNQIVANSTEELAKANSDKLTASGIANIILYY